MPREERATWKSNYFLKIIQLLDDYPKCFIVGADNVGSKQMQQIRMSLSGKAVVLMGKNTMMRKAIRGHLENNPALEKLLPHIRGNVGFVFTKEDLSEIRDMLLANKVPAAAHAGAIAPCEVTVPAQNTGLGPEKTSFSQALRITTKISRGTIEILRCPQCCQCLSADWLPNCCISTPFYHQRVQMSPGLVCGHRLHLPTC
ncbi:60S acidic ribosomal protein P0-like isoform X2 [Theropithecus gelada]|uniref:60S acidic ribosomal protein P0-like isoform X2 n=1 Tax=Theropithecus gelada TaxID=9565 RepID=UPI000DC17284|nr:60S acidic ribosomal protein P0-like isoform X2 [Theropithecus gelada]